MKMAEGNPGALNVCMSIFTEGALIDPDDIMGGFGTLLTLDSFGIYGSKIWMIYQDICAGHLTTFIGLIRAVQLGIMPRAELLSALDADYASMEPSRVGEIMLLVKERLPKFGQVTA